MSAGRHDQGALGGVYQALLLGKSRVMQRVREEITNLAALPWHVRIEGPSGSGKTLAARLLHRLSPLARGPFVVCSLAMLPDGMELAELVGHRRGSYTGAVEDRAGMVEQAHGGMLFLDELGTASGATQRALLQLVDEHSFRRIGDSRVVQVDVRLVFATNVDLEEKVTNGSFREDLYHRLGTLVVRMPPLSDHREDIPEIAERCLAEKCREAHRGGYSISSQDMDLLMSYDWPGNVRELGKALEHFVAFGRLPEHLGRPRREEHWRDQVDAALIKYRGNKSAAARALGIPRSMLYTELKRREA